MEFDLFELLLLFGVAFPIALFVLVVLATKVQRIQKALIYLHWVKPYSFVFGIPECSSRHSTCYVTANDMERIPVWVWTTDSDRSTRKNEREEIVVVYLHGNAETRAFPKRRQQYENIKRLFETTRPNMRVTLLIPEYRGFGERGYLQPSEDWLVKDAVSVVRHAQKEGARHVFLWGQSMGSGVAAHAARVLCECGSPQIDQLILEAPFRTIPHAALNHWVGYPLRLLPSFALKYVIDHIKDVFLTEEHLPKVCQAGVPTIILHGQKDWVISHDQSVRLIQMLDDSGLRGMVDFISFPNAGHTGCTYQSNFSDVGEKLVFREK